jgi:hypothetical protein
MTCFADVCCNVLHMQCGGHGRHMQEAQRFRREQRLVVQRSRRADGTRHEYVKPFTPPHQGCEARLLLRETVTLPRQARDKHRHSCGEKSGVLSRRGSDRTMPVADTSVFEVRTCSRRARRMITHTYTHAQTYIYRHTYLLGTANCIIIAPKRLKLRLPGSARKSQKRFRDTPMFKFQAVLARTQPFHHAAQRNGATKPDSNAEKWSIIMQFAVGRLGCVDTQAHRDTGM